MIEIDGSMGEGGGQILRTSLSLSLLTGQRFTLRRVRARRDKPGLRPQHLAALHAAAGISDAAVAGNEVGSLQVSFSPGRIRPGSYRFDIGTAGATALVLQTLLPPLAIASGTSQLTIQGGTHVQWSPCFHYLDWHWRVFLARIGIPFQLSMPSAGFYPRGGGEIRADIPGGARPVGLDCTRRGALRRIRGLSAVANLPEGIAERQRDQAVQRLNALCPGVEQGIDLASLPAGSPGTVLLLLAEFEHSQACFFGLGARGKRAEQVADEAVDGLAAFLLGDGAVDAWLADQLLLPLALASTPSALRTSAVSQHLLTNAEVIRHFLPVEIVIDGPLGKPGNIKLHPPSDDPQ